MPRISQLPSLTSADNADEIAIVDVSAAATKRITRGDLLKSPLPTDSVTTAAVTNGAITADKLDFTTFSKGWGTNTADINISTSGNYSSLTSVTIKLNKAGTVEINALATIKLANNQETNIRLMNGSTGLFEIAHQSSDTTLIRTHGANIQVDLPAGTHNLLLQIRAFGGSAGTHMIYTRNATMSVRVI